MIGDIAFYLLAFLTLMFGVLVVANPLSRNPVTSAMCLVMCIVSMAGLFVLLGALFLAAVQILVYAGAVMVLFLFVIMLMDLKEEERRKWKVFGLATGGLAVGAVGAILLRLIWTSHVAEGVVPTLLGEPKPLGRVLFDKFLLPFEVLSLLLLVAMVGAILLSKKDLK